MISVLQVSDRGATVRRKSVLQADDKRRVQDNYVSNKSQYRKEGIFFTETRDGMWHRAA